MAVAEQGIGFPSGWTNNRSKGGMDTPPVAPEFRRALLELFRQYQGDEAVDLLREGVRWLAEILRELEVSEQVGGGPV